MPTKINGDSLSLSASHKHTHTHTHTHRQSLVTPGLKFHKDLLRIPTNLGKFKKLTDNAGHQLEAKNTKLITMFYGKQGLKDKL